MAPRYSQSNQASQNPERQDIAEFRDLVAARAEFENACTSFASAQQRRDEAQQRLSDLLEAIGERLSTFSQDPTQPPTPEQNQALERPKMKRSK